MKRIDLKSPGYTQKPRTVHQWHQVPGNGLCPSCGKFAAVGRTKVEGEFKTQYRYCKCGQSSQTVIRLTASADGAAVGGAEGSADKSPQPEGGDDEKQIPASHRHNMALEVGPLFTG